MRVAVLMLALTLITSCFVGGTFAKYITSNGSSDVARVAKWGVVLESFTDSSFKTEYTNDAGDITVQYQAGGTTDNLVAPGTKDDEGVTFKISGTPEVATKVTMDMQIFNDVYLSYYTYDDEGNQTGTETYTPVVFTLWIKDGNGEEATFVEAESGTLSDIESFFETNLGYAHSTETITDGLGTREVGVYNFAPGEVLDAEYKLTWAWDFDDNGAGTNDSLDTILGNCAADIVGSEVESYNTNIEYMFGVTVEQVD